MARVTVEDCLENVANRFELVRISSRRARQLERTSLQPLVPAENDKPTVIALREIADNLISDEILNEFEREQQARDEDIFIAPTMPEPVIVPPKEDEPPL